MMRLCSPAIALAMFSACTTADIAEDDDSASGSGSSGTPGPAPKVVDIMADTNRDGYVTVADNEGEATWGAAQGAAFLANLDDDNGDGVPDANDGIVNISPDNDADKYDLAPLIVNAWPEAPTGSMAWLTLTDDNAIRNVRVFKQLAGGNYELVLGSDGACGFGGDTTCHTWLHAVSFTAEEVRQGVVLGIEAKRYAGMTEANTGMVAPWDGSVTLKFEMYEGGSAEPIKTQDNPDDGVDWLQMRVAPWILFGNLTTTTDVVFSSNYYAEFVGGIEAAFAADAPNVYYHKIQGNQWQDQWTEDFFQTGFSSVPWAEGQVHGMRVAMPRPWGRPPNNADPTNYMPMRFLENYHTHQDSGAVQVYLEDQSGDSYDSYGNHDLIPPHTNGDKAYPYGRIIYGSGVLAETKVFYEAQRVQSPAVTVDTSWLIVGHVDEVFSYVPAGTERGWKLFVGSPRLAISMMQQWQSQGHGATQMFVGKNWQGGKSAAISIDDVLADPELMSWAQEAQTKIDGMLAIVKSEVGLADDEIIEIPYLFEKEGNWGMVAYNPGTSNAMVFDNLIIHPDPFGPSINGQDGFKQDLIARLASPANKLGKDGQGLQVHFTDDWSGYHVLLGEVHCGSNQEGPPQADIKWWEASK
jgi:protein-arginine deiminase